MSWKKRILLGSGLCVLFLAGLIAHRLFKKGSNAPLVLIAAPVVYTEPNIDPFDNLTPAERTTVVDVFFASNRQGKGLPSDRVYANSWSDHLHLGKAQVQFGDKTTTWEQLHAASLSPDRSVPMPVTLAQSQEFGVLARTVETNGGANQPKIGDQAFAQAINQTLATKRNREIKVYIHGYKVDFAHGCQMGAQLHHFAVRGGVTVAFNWACRQRDITYFSDQERARQSIPDLVDLIEF
ncbi:alpha/beta hydrolase, partial [Planctomycetota bacterium]